MWQDWALTIVQFVFIASLIPTLLHPYKKPTLATAGVTAAGVIVVAYVYYSLELWLSVVCALILCSEWTTLAVQRWNLDKRGLQND